MSRPNFPIAVTSPVSFSSSHPAATEWNPQPNASLLFAMGATWDTLDQYWEVFNARWEARIQNPPPVLAVFPAAAGSFIPSLDDNGQMLHQLAFVTPAGMSTLKVASVTKVSVSPTAPKPRFCPGCTLQ
ncbi:hypothetical protein EVG20_g9218 [Dentipellis fragilis]|uniref:Uncharacterized protein n=1 Tax=Dentipellis fragilis TaxID=205917 RepID=A0A4Y9Y045_9AGAM|nr:hypothetical protein EVG20_g9218 [Dentipellis fragilis]